MLRQKSFFQLIQHEYLQWMNKISKQSIQQNTCICVSSSENIATHFSIINLTNIVEQLSC